MRQIILHTNALTYTEKEKKDEKLGAQTLWKHETAYTIGNTGLSL
jgi:hypothetical protein